MLWRSRTVTTIAKVDGFIDRLIETSPKVLHDYLRGCEFAHVEDRYGRPNATVQIVEASAVLILGGSHIVFLPHHYC